MRNLCFIILSALSLTTFAQQKKQVAILEPVAITNQVSLMHRSMVRGEMVKAIGRQEGYAAFTRTDIDKIMNEQNFQQSGMVDDDTRIRVGDMKGVDYLCVTKVSKEGNNYYMEAVLVHVGSGEITQPATQFVELSGGSLANLLTACESLATELVGVQNKVTYRDVNIYVDTPAAFYVNGTLVEKGKKTAIVTLHRGEDVELVIRAEGFLEHRRILRFSENITSYDLTRELSVDEAYAASEPFNISGVPQEIIVKKGLPREDALRGINIVLDKNLKNLNTKYAMIELVAIERSGNMNNILAVITFVLVFRYKRCLIWVMDN